MNSDAGGKSALGEWLGLVPECAEVRPLQEDDRPQVTRILQALPEQPPTPYAGWARYRNECADFVDRLRAALKAQRSS